MCCGELPRLYELIDLVEDRGAPGAYFQDFENSLSAEPQKKRVWLAREAELSELDENAWDFLKKEAHPYLATHDPKRGWQQLITILNQARAYNFLKSLGCSNPRFVPRSAAQTPDLEGELSGCKVLCEVKTINVSDEEATARRKGAVRTIKDRLETGFFNKLRSALEAAKEQMEKYSGGTNARQIAYLIINFDDLLAEYKGKYFRRIDEYLAKTPVPGLEIVFHNEKTVFNTQIAMKSATVVNE